MAYGSYTRKAWRCGRCGPLGLLVGCCLLGGNTLGFVFFLENWWRLFGRVAAGKMSSQTGKDRLLLTINLHAGPGSSGSVLKTSLLAEHVTGGGVGEVSDVPRVDR